MTSSPFADEWLYLGTTVSRLSLEPGTKEILFEAYTTSRLSWEWDWDIVPNAKAESVSGFINYMEALSMVLMPATV
jgi:hypothetical protein